MRNQLLIDSDDFQVLRHTLFKMYADAALLVEEKNSQCTLKTHCLLFVNDQVFILAKEYLKWGLDINYKKIEHLIIEGPGTIIQMNSDPEKNIIIQRKIERRSLNSVFWDNKITQIMKRILFHITNESITTYELENWKLTGRNNKHLEAVEMAFW